MTDERDEKVLAFELWLEGKPAIIQEMARDYPPYICYRSKEHSRAHYTVAAYNENGTMSMVHGRDSFLPGVTVFGFNPNDLVRCDCGLWLGPTAEQIEATGKRIERARLARN